MRTVKSIDTEDYSIFLEEHVTVTRFHNELDVSMAMRAIDKVVELDVTGRRLWDITQCLILNVEQIRQIAEYGKAKESMPVKVAGIAADHLSFGLLRMLGVYRTQEDFVFSVFRNEQEARAWLLDGVQDQ
ncbi:MAG: hypothetical protein ACJAYE_001153 [Candidatus Azotimanducaceae bacterium]|jgi:hypothetical protein